MSEKLMRWNGSEWVEVLSINRVECDCEGGEGFITGYFERVPTEPKVFTGYIPDYVIVGGF